MNFIRSAQYVLKSYIENLICTLSAIFSYSSRGMPTHYSTRFVYKLFFVKPSIDFR